MTTSAIDLKGRSLASLKDFTPEEILHILDTAEDIKKRFRAGEAVKPMKGRMMAMIFQKPSLRTRVSFETGMFQMGGAAMYLGPNDIGLGKRETTEDIAKVLSRQADVIMARVFGHEVIEDLAKHSAVPVINGLSDFTHPCQALADLMTIREWGKPFKGCRLVYIGDANNVANSLVFGGVQLGMEVVVVSPPGYQVAGNVRSWAGKTAERSGGSLTVSGDPKDAVRDADVLYTDVWTSMGQEGEADDRRSRFAGYQINAELLGLAKKDAMVLHCLPAHYGEEITHDVAHGKQSALWDEAENRLHAQKGLVALLAGS